MRSKKPVLAGIVGALVVWQTLALNPFHVSAKNETGDHPASQILPGTITRQHGKGLYAIVFSVAAGAITVNVPDDIEAGDTVSINLKEQMVQGLAPAAQATVRKRLDAYTIVFADQTISAGRGFSKVTIPGVVPTGFLPLILSLNKQEVLRTYVECAPRSHLPVGGAALSGGKQNPTFQLPQAIQAGRSMQIFGNFNGDMSDTHVRFTADPHEPRSRSDNLSRRWLSSVGSRWAFGSETSNAPTASKELDLLAESPRMLVCQSPTDIIGPVEVEISEAGRTIKARSRNVSLNLSAARTSLEKGQSTELEIDIDGLQEITEPLNFTLDN